MSYYPYFPYPAHYASSHHVARDDRGNTNSVFIENSFQVNSPSTPTNPKSKRSRNTPPAGTPAPNPHHFLTPPIGNNLPGHVVHFSENSHNVQTTHISNIGGLTGNLGVPLNVPRRPSAKKAKQRTAAPKVQDEDMDSEETSSTSSFDEVFDTFDDFSISNRHSRRSRPAKPHAPSMFTVPPVPQPTHYLSTCHIPISAPMPYYDPVGGLGAMIDASVQATMNQWNQVVHERIQAQEANTRAIQAQAAARATKLAARAGRKVKIPSATATTKREDVPSTRRSPCPGFLEDKTTDHAGNTIINSKLCSHSNCAFMGDNFTPSSQGFSRSSNSWRSPDCELACPGSVRHEETDSLGNIKVTSKLCSHEANPKETIDSDSDSDTDVESASDSDDSTYEKAKRASMRPSVQDVSDDEDGG